MPRAHTGPIQGFAQWFGLIPRTMGGGTARDTVPSGDPGRTRTFNQAIKSRLLYQIELRGPAYPTTRLAQRDQRFPGVEFVGQRFVFYLNEADCQ
jgi:hypothetical protein